MNQRINLTEVSAVADLIRDMLGDDMDDQAFIDTLDGETDVADALTAMVKRREECRAVEAAMKDLAAIYTARARRHAETATSITRAMGAVLDAIGEQKVALDVATISRTKPRQSCNIFDATAVPTQLCKSVPDTAAVKKQLEAGENVPGAELQWGAPGLTVRVK